MKPTSTRIGRRSLALLLGLALAAAPLLPAARPAQAAATFTVTTVGDNADADPGNGTCDTTLSATTAPCSLRAAIQEANATADLDTIAFNIPGDGLKTIRPTTLLPTITNQVTIAGYTQLGSSPNTAQTGTNAVLRIELDGSAIAGFGYHGLQVESGDGTLIRGLVINRFSEVGIELEFEATNTRIAGCFVGTDAAGTAARGNSFGVFVDDATRTQIGGSGPAARNLISGNDFDGVRLTDAAVGTRILGNLIGTTRSGAAPLGNGDQGIDSSASNTVIGGATAGEANVIAFNGNRGVRIFVGTGVRVLRNSIFANAGPGIELSNGPTPNDPGDPDSGANTLQNYPVIETATSAGVSGTLNSTPNQRFVLRLFSNPASQNEGEVFEAGPLVVTTNADGNATFTFAPNPPIPAGRSVTVTATNQGGSTSEFSAAVAVSP